MDSLPGEILGKCGFNPWVRKIPWRRKWQPTPVFFPGISHGQMSLVAYSPCGCKESDRAEHARCSTTLITHDYMYPFPPEPPPLPPSHPSRSSQSTRLGSLCYLATSHYFTHDSVYRSMSLLQFVPPSPFPTVSTTPFSTRFIRTIFIDSIYMC